MKLVKPKKNPNTRRLRPYIGTYSEDPLDGLHPRKVANANVNRTFKKRARRDGKRAVAEQAL